MLASLPQRIKEIVQAKEGPTQEHQSITNKVVGDECRYKTNKLKSDVIFLSLF